LIVLFGKSSVSAITHITRRTQDYFKMDPKQKDFDVAENSVERRHL